MTFITPKQELSPIVYQYANSPSTLKLELRRKGYRYVKVRKGGLVKYILRPIKGTSQKIIIKL